MYKCHFEKRGELDLKSRRCAFLGYGGDDKGYRLWDSTERKTNRSHDVIFREHMIFRGSKQEEQKNDKFVAHMQIDSCVPPQQVQWIHPQGRDDGDGYGDINGYDDGMEVIEQEDDHDDEEE